MFSKSLLAQSRTLTASLKARNSLSSVVLSRHVSSGKLSMPLQWQRSLSTSLALRNDESRYEERGSRYEERGSRFEERGSKPRGFRRPVVPSGTLYIGNLPYSITEEELRQSFMEFGEIVRLSLGVFLRAASKYLREVLTGRTRCRDHARGYEPGVRPHSIFQRGRGE
jgi:nucleolin